MANEYDIAFIKHQYTVPFQQKLFFDFVILMKNNNIVILEVDDISHNKKDVKYRDKLKEIYAKYHFYTELIRIKDTDDYVKILDEYFKNRKYKLIKNIYIILTIIIKNIIQNAS